METMLAESAERECYAVDGGTFHFEWCARATTAQEREMLPLEDRFRAGVGVYRRRVDTPVRTDADGLDWIEWRLYAYGPTLADACASMGDGSWYAATSLHPEHAASVERYRRSLARHAAMEILRDFYHAQERAAQSSREAAQRAFTTGLKRARLWQLAEKNAAPQDKVDAIKARVRAEYGPMIEQASTRARMARAKLEQRGFGGMLG